MSPARIADLATTIRDRYHCAAAWVESVHVIEVYQGGEIAWRGDVEVFDVDHPEATRAYACMDSHTGHERELVIVLGRGSVSDATTAVRAVVQGATS